jgi:hypothetical protein
MDFDNLNNEIKDLQKENTSLIRTVDNFDNTKKVVLLFSILFILSFLINLKITSDLVLKLFLLILLSYILINQIGKYQNDNDRDYKIKLNFIQELCFDNTYLYFTENNLHIRPSLNYIFLNKYPELINFYFKQKRYSQINLLAYKKSVKYANYLASIGINVNQKRTRYNLKDAKSMMTQCLNEFQSCIINTPLNSYENKNFTQVLKQLEQILYNILISIRDKMQKENKDIEINYRSTPDVNEILQISEFKPEIINPKNKLKLDPHFDVF